jgi:Protein of unknown function (DUF993)
MTTIKLPTAIGHQASYRMSPPRAWATSAGPFDRVAFAAAHVVADPLAELFRLADRAGLLADPERAAGPMRKILAVHGVEA